MGAPLKVSPIRRGLTADTVAAALAEFVAATGQTQRQIAKRMGSSHSTISKMLRGRQLRVDNVNALLSACDRSWQDLLAAAGAEPSREWHNEQEVIALLADLRRENQRLRARLRGK